MRRRGSANQITIRQPRWATTDLFFKSLQSHLNIKSGSCGSSPNLLVLLSHPSVGCGFQNFLPAEPFGFFGTGFSFGLGHELVVLCANCRVSFALKPLLVWRPALCRPSPDLLLFMLN